jgi:predicted RNase H-like HicB family nuclease
MFEFRLRILDMREREADPPSFLGIVEGFPNVLVHATSPEETERNLTLALVEHLKRLQEQDATRLEEDDFPRSRLIRLYLQPNAGLTRGEGGRNDPRAGFRAMTTSIAFRCGTPLALEMNSTCPESKICQSQ